MLESILLTIAAYLIGAIPTAYLVARQIRGVDIRNVGSGNVGTLNTFKEIGVAAGVTVLTLDTAKGAVVMALILAFDIPSAGAFAAALAVTLGHNFSAFLKFSGGKGVAVVFGLSIVVFPILTALALATLPIAWLLTRSIVWAFATAFITLNILTITTRQDTADVGLCLTLSLIVIGTHLWRNQTEVLDAVQRLDFTHLGKIE